jgi:hypothetical protein
MRDPASSPRGRLPLGGSGPRCGTRGGHRLRYPRPPNGRSRGLASPHDTCGRTRLDSSTGKQAASVMWRGPDPSKGRRQSPDRAAALGARLPHLELDLLELIGRPRVVAKGPLACWGSAGSLSVGQTRVAENAGATAFDTPGLQQAAAGVWPRHMTLAAARGLNRAPGNRPQVSCGVGLTPRRAAGRAPIAPQRLALGCPT